MDCREVKDSLSAYLDQVLDKLNEDKIKEHLKECQACQEELASLKMALNFLKNSQEVSPPVDFRSNLRSRLEEVKQEEQVLTQPKWINRFQKHWFKVGAVAAAAILILIVGLPSLIQEQHYDIAAQKETTDDMQAWNFADGKASERAGQDTATQNIVQDNDMQMSKVEDYGANNSMKNSAMPESGAEQWTSQGEPKLLDEAKSKSAEAPERKVITEGSIGLEVTSITKISEKIVKSVEAKGGFIQRTYFNEQQNGMAQLVLRIPVEDFEQVLDGILKLGKVRFKETNGQDVTEEYLDTEARLYTLKTQEERLLALIKEGKNLEEILKIEKELQRVREEIEKLEGRLKVINDLAGLATLNVELYQDSLVPAASSSIEAPGIKGVFQRMVNAVIDSSNNLLNFFGLSVVFFGGALPYLVLLVLAGAGYYWAKRRYFNNKR